MSLGDGSEEDGCMDLNRKNESQTVARELICICTYNGQPDLWNKKSKDIFDPQLFFWPNCNNEKGGMPKRKVGALEKLDADLASLQYKLRRDPL